MDNYIFLLPLYNDWKSLRRLLVQINLQTKKLNKKAEILVVDDNSTNISKINIRSLKNIKKIKILRLNENLGSQKAISIGLTYLQSLKRKSIITILDSDGEDDSSKIAEMINCAKKNKDSVIVSCRSKRQDGIIFNFFYFIHKTITFLFTAKWINFGNYSSFNSINLKKILINWNSWFAYSSCISKNCNLIKLYAERKKRYYGKSKLSFAALFFHSLRVSFVYFPRIVILSIIYILLGYSCRQYFSLISYLLFLSIIFFNLGMIYTFFKVKPFEYYKSKKFIQK